ncbi:MAG: phenylacetate--CoA ligase family protein [Candidatus Thermoplasmatota archaeon]|nr:phenylacetate--CoA ligase family protein [Candidatus Thermoplasmatota archaeon]
MQITNPFQLLHIVADYLSDINRLNYATFEQMRRHQNRAFCNLIKYAYRVPLYKQKFDEAGIRPGDITGIKDIKKLPIINRQDVINYYPSGTVAPELKKRSVTVNTSGSTRNPVTLYVDQYTLIKALIAYVRELRQYGIRWNTSKMSIIANFYSGTAPTQYFDAGANPTLKPVKPLISLKNIQQLNADDDLTEMIQKVDAFKPDCIFGFPGPLRHLALLKEKGYGKHLHPRCIISSGGIMDSYEKKRIEEIFQTRVFDVYGSTEAGPVAFECEEGEYHINSDFVYIEAIDANDNPVDKGKTGKLAITRLYGRGTPLIRYTGMGDVIALKKGICSCGRQTELLGKVHGRIKESIVLPNHKIIFPNVLIDVPGKVMRILNTDKIDRLQVVQQEIDEIDILVIINNVRRDEGVPIETLFDELKKEYKTVFGPDVKVTVKEVTKLVSETGGEETSPGILTKIDASEYL